LKAKSQTNIKHEVRPEQVSLWLYDGNRATPPSFITPPYLSQVAVNLTFFATRQASTAFTKSSDRLNLETSALWTAPTAIATDVPGSHVG
jgi:hypothetical protein